MFFVPLHIKPQLLEVFNRHAGQMCISSITLAELLHSVKKSSAPDHNLLKVEDFLSRLEVLQYGIKAAFRYGEIKADLERKGTPIGVNDLPFAGYARSEGLTWYQTILFNFRLLRRYDVGY